MVRRAPSHVHSALWLIVVGLILAITLILLIAGVNHAAKYAAILGAVATIVSTGVALSSLRKPDGSDTAVPSSTAGRTSAWVWPFVVVMAVALTVTGAALLTKDHSTVMPPEPTSQPRTSPAPPPNSPAPPRPPSSSAPAIPGKGTCSAHGSGTCGVNVTADPSGGTGADCRGGGNGSGGGGCGVRVGGKD